MAGGRGAGGCAIAAGRGKNAAARLLQHGKALTALLRRDPSGLSAQHTSCQHTRRRTEPRQVVAAPAKAAREKVLVPRPGPAVCNASTGQLIVRRDIAAPALPDQQPHALLTRGRRVSARTTRRVEECRGMWDRLGAYTNERKHVGLVERAWASAVASAPTRIIASLHACLEQVPHEVARRAGMLVSSLGLLLIVLERTATKAGVPVRRSTHTQLFRGAAAHSERMACEIAWFYRQKHAQTHQKQLSPSGFQLVPPRTSCLAGTQLGGRRLQ